MKRRYFGLMAGLVFLLACCGIYLNRPVTQVIFSAEQSPLSRGNLWERVDLLTPTVSMVHSSFIVNSPDNAQIVFWYGGSGEAARDVQIYRAVISEGRLSDPARAILSPARMSCLTGRFISKLGNPVGWYRDHTLYLAVVNVSLSGWAASRVDLLASSDDGLTFNHHSSLRTSPVINVSTLIRTRPHAIESGLLLPAYFELSRLNPMLLYLDRDMRLVRSTTLRMKAIQPEVVPIDTMEAQLFARPEKEGLVRTARLEGPDEILEPLDAGTLQNPSSALSVLRLPDSALLMVHNPGSDRSRLCISMSSDKGHTWRKVKVLEDRRTGSFSYPSLTLDTAGVFHLSYTSNRKKIIYHRFTMDALGTISEDQE